MESVIYAIITVLAWGTWLVPSQNVPMKGQQIRTFYVTLAVMLLAIIVILFVGLDGLNPITFWFPFLGGIIWTFSGWSAFVGTSRMGMAKAFGIWAPMNIVVSVIWGMILFGEFLDLGLLKVLIAIAAFLAIIGGILLIIFAGSTTGDEKHSKRDQRIGLLGAIGAGIGFASYFIPIQIGTANYPGFTMWVGMLPLSIGMVVGSSILLVTSKLSPKLEKSQHYMRVISTGLLWGTGNYGALLMMEKIGTGHGFTIAQLCVVVNVLIGIFILKILNLAPKLQN